MVEVIKRAGVLSHHHMIYLGCHVTHFSAFYHKVNLKLIYLAHEIKCVYSVCVRVSLYLVHVFQCVCVCVLGMSILDR